MNSSSDKGVVKDSRNGTFRRFRGLRLRSSVLSNTVKIMGVIATCFLLEACYGAPRSSFKKMPVADRSTAEAARKKSAEAKTVSPEVQDVSQETAVK